MSKSLNQAFIKAYSKEQANQSSKPPSAVQQAFGNDELIVRFDTATCSIPATHRSPSDPSVNKPRTTDAADTRSLRSASRTEEFPQRVAPRPSAIAPMDETTQELNGQIEDSTAALRSAIAEQMSRAGYWDGLSIDAFSGGFPMLSMHHRIHSPQSRVPPPHTLAPNSRQKVSASDGQSLKTIEAAAEVEKEAVSSFQEGQSGEGESKPTVRVAPLASAPTAELTPAETWPSPSSAQSSPLFATFSGSSRGGASPPEELDAPTLQTPTLQTPTLQTPTLQSPVLLSQQQPNMQGEFFRLDRPSYAASGALPSEGQLSDSGDFSSEYLGLPTNHRNSETTVQATEPAVHLDVEQTIRIEQAQSVERELRRAKLRIFNPVWEVDSLQWPDICLELLAQRSDSLDTVARNLSQAVQEGLQVLAVTSPLGGEGCTTVACCLAKLAGSRGLNVAIVDGDIENPTLSYQTNLDVEQDWRTAILNQLPLEEIAVHSIDDQVTLVPLIGPIDPTEMATDDNRIEFMLHELSESFDLVIVDMGHMNSPRSLVGSLGSRGVISAIVAVVDHRTADTQQIDLCLRRIRQTGVASIGVVENFAA